MERKLLDVYLDSKYFVSYFETTPNLFRAVVNRLNDKGESEADSREVITMTKNDLIELVFDVTKKYYEKKLK